MNQLTTIASLPSGGGQAQALKAETVEVERFEVMVGGVPKLMTHAEYNEMWRTGVMRKTAENLAALGYALDEKGFIIHLDKG